ncbi:hypothetical protein [Maribacter polysaccharolyticus]|uniref:hypothetical protein n=1 Tax=Maribacter polysaccharolyticus TaxID=3020831 RepID=UPI00237EFFC2|nr:hypothetical protein [Maribacter polysaccharolyticus]MDE3744065.1 hypothetical protein [Maribacter polysaccharolyticus]
MAKIIDNPKGFKVIELDRDEFFSIGGMSLCDGCNQKMKKGFFIAVLNRSYCEEDYHSWSERAVRYQEDIDYELTKFNQMKSIFNL